MPITLYFLLKGCICNALRIVYDANNILIFLKNSFFSVSIVMFMYKILDPIMRLDLLLTLEKCSGVEPRTRQTQFETHPATYSWLDPWQCSAWYIFKAPS